MDFDWVTLRPIADDVVGPTPIEIPATLVSPTREICLGILELGIIIELLYAPNKLFGGRVTVELGFLPIGGSLVLLLARA